MRSIIIPTLLFCSLVFSQQEANFFFRNGQRRIGEFMRMSNDTIYIQVKKSENKVIKRAVHKNLFIKVVFFTGEHLNLALSNYPEEDKEDDLENWDDVGTQTGLIAETPVEKTKSSKTTIAVTDFEARSGVSENDAASLSDRFREKLIAANVFRVMERNEMDLILKEQGFQQTGVCTDNECLVEIGQMIAVQKIISGSIGKVGGIYTVSAKILDVSTGAIDKTVSEDCDCPIEELLTVAMNRLARKIAGLKVEEVQRKIIIKRGIAALFVKSTPQGARIYLDGKLIDGITPLNVENLTPGRHTLRLTKGDLVASDEVVLEENKVTRIHRDLEKQKTILKVTSNPSEAEVYLTEKPGKKVKPDQITPAIFEDIYADRLSPTIFKVGYLDTTLSIKIKQNQTNNISVDLREAKVELVNKQKKMVRDRKQRSIGIKLSVGGLAVAAGGGFLFYLAQKDYNDAAEAKELLENSAIKSGADYENKVKENEDKNNSGNLRSTISMVLFGVGGASLGLGIVLIF